MLDYDEHVFKCCTETHQQRIETTFNFLFGFLLQFAWFGKFCNLSVIFVLCLYSCNVFLNKWTIIIERGLAPSSKKRWKRADNGSSISDFVCSFLKKTNEEPTNNICSCVHRSYLFYLHFKLFCAYVKETKKNNSKIYDPRKQRDLINKYKKTHTQFWWVVKDIRNVLFTAIAI